MKTRSSPLPPKGLAWILFGGAACFLAVTPPVSAAPPLKRQGERVAQDVGGFFFRVARKLEQPVPNPEARMVRTRTYKVTVPPDTEVQVETSRPRPQLGTTNPATRVWDPVTQQWLPPNMVPRRNAYSSGGAVPSGGAITVPSSQPSMPAVRLQPRPGGNSPVITDADINAMRQQEGTRYLDPYGPEAAEAYATALRREPAADTSSSLSEPSAPASATESRKPAVSSKPAAPQTPAEYGTRVPGKPGFVYPPGVEQDTKNMLDVRGLTAGQKVRDPRNGHIFLVP